MMATKRRLPAVVITGSSILVGCGSGSNGSCGSGSACVVPPPGTGGVFSGTVKGTAAVALYADSGDMRISVQDGTYYHLTTAPQSQSVVGNYFAYSTGAPFPNGTSATTGTMSATEGVSALSGTLTDASGSTLPFSLKDDTVYGQGSALSKLAGTWSSTANGFSLTVTIASDGSLSGTDSNGCTYTGAFAQIDARYDVYRESHVATCNAAKSTYDGLASYRPPAGASTARIELLSDDGAGSALTVELQ